MAILYTVLLPLGLLLLGGTVKCQEQLDFDGWRYSGVKTGENNREYFAFYGVHYARQPVGRYRFSRPESLSTVRKSDLTPEETQIYQTGSLQRKSCPQIDVFSPGTQIGDEDCLRIDFYIPKKQFENNQNWNAMPIGILIEGFDFRSGVAHKIQPTFEGWGSTDMILAVVHYRLGALGFLTTEDEYGPGNLGLWDQQKAINFIKVNCRTLRGDCEKISVLGFGAGGISTSYHLLNRVTVGMFQNVLISGGSALSPDGNVKLARDTAFAIGRASGCSQSSTKGLMECLRKADLRHLVRAGSNPNFSLGPVVDKNHTRQQDLVYIPAAPEVLMKITNSNSNLFTNIRTGIYGYTENAGSYRYYFENSRQDGSRMNQNEPDLINYIEPYFRKYLPHEDTRYAISAAVKFQYFRNYTYNDSTSTDSELKLNLTMRFLTDYLHGAPVMTAARFHAEQKRPADKDTGTGVYIYVRKNLAEPPSFSRAPIFTGGRAGSTNMDDLLQFINVLGVTQQITNYDSTMRDKWREVMKASFIEVTTTSRQVNRGQLQPFLPDDLSANVYCNELDKDGFRQVKEPYLEQERSFWSGLVPTLRKALNNISEKSNDRYRRANSFTNATIGTTVTLVVLVIIVIVLAVLLIRQRKNKAEGSVSFKAVSTSDNRL